MVSKSQNEFGLDDFDLIICDEAHRTTGATLTDEDESHFVKIHNNEFVAGKKDLYDCYTKNLWRDSKKERT